jgi:hypothetical protein
MLAVVTLCYCTYRLLVRELVLRHIFIQSSDWCAYKIDKLVERADYTIIEEVRHRYPEYTDERARMHVPTEITNAKADWEKQCDEFQKKLAANGMAPLSKDDWVFGLSNLVR